MGTKRFIMNGPASEAIMEDEPKKAEEAPRVEKKTVGRPRKRTDAKSSK